MFQRDRRLKHDAKEAGLTFTIAGTGGEKTFP